MKTAPERSGVRDVGQEIRRVVTEQPDQDLDGGKHQHRQPHQRKDHARNHRHYQQPAWDAPVRRDLRPEGRRLHRMVEADTHIATMARQLSSSTIWFTGPTSCPV